MSMPEHNKNIGMLRQWLNEERITDPKKMVTNKELEVFLCGDSLESHDCQETMWCEVCLKKYCENCAIRIELLNSYRCPDEKCLLTNKHLTLIPL